MRIKIALSILAALLVAVLFSVIVWVGGYNFDTRSFLAAYMLSFGMFFSTCAGVIVFQFLDVSK